MKTRLHYIDRLFTLLVIMVLFAMCARPTLAQQCGFDHLNQTEPHLPAFYERDFDEVHIIPVVVHVVHNSADPLGVGSNITDTQVVSMISDLNDRMENNINGDVGYRYCLAGTDPDGDETTGITRQTWTAEYDANGVAVSGSIGEPNGAVQSTFGWPHNDYYNIYVVSTIMYNGSPVIAGFAYFPINSYLDGTVIRYDRMTVGTTTLIHEIGHSLGLYHTFENTSLCDPETNCATQGDRVCDTNPATSWSPCSNNCPAGYPPAPFINYMSYSQCRIEFTEGQIDRAHLISDNSSVRQSLYASDVCATSTPPDDPELCDDGCPNDLCETATELTECVPSSFCNTNCTDDSYDVLVHPTGNVACGGEEHQSGQWFKFTTTTFGYWQMDIDASMYTSIDAFGNYGALEGIEWKLAKGECDDLEWIAASSCPTWPVLCYCPSPVAAENCETLSCSSPAELIPFWWTLSPPQFPTGDWLPFDPTRQEWHMTFPLPAGTYYFLLSGFLYYNFSDGNLYPSLGDGTITICHEVPLSNKPVLTRDGLTLHWTGETATDWAIFRLNESLEWGEIARTNQQQFDITESGYYIVAGSTVFSNAIYLEIQNINEPLRYDILGREGAKMWINDN